MNPYWMHFIGKMLLIKINNNAISISNLPYTWKKKKILLLFLEQHETENQISTVQCPYLHHREKKRMHNMINPSKYRKWSSFHTSVFLRHNTTDQGSGFIHLIIWWAENISSNKKSSFWCGLVKYCINPGSSQQKLSLSLLKRHVHWSLCNASFHLKW